MDNFLGLLCFTVFILFCSYHAMKKRTKFIPPEVIIGHRKYYDIVDRVYIDVIDFDGYCVYYKLEGESEICDPIILNKTEFLKRFKKVGRPDIGIVHDNEPVD